MVASWALLLYKKGDEFIQIGFLEETRANRATLKSLIEGEKEQAGLLENATELQAKWVQGYLALRYCSEGARASFREGKDRRSAIKGGMLTHIESHNLSKNVDSNLFSRNRLVKTIT